MIRELRKSEPTNAAQREVFAHYNSVKNKHIQMLKMQDRFHHERTNLRRSIERLPLPGLKAARTAETTKSGLFGPLGHIKSKSTAQLSRKPTGLSTVKNSRAFFREKENKRKPSPGILDLRNPAVRQCYEKERFKTTYFVEKQLNKKSAKANASSKHYLHNLDLMLYSAK